MIVSQANDYFGYVITRDQYWEGGYEEKMSFFGPGLAGLINGEVIRMVDELDVKAHLSHQEAHSVIPKIILKRSDLFSPQRKRERKARD